MAGRKKKWDRRKPCKRPRRSKRADRRKTCAPKVRRSSARRRSSSRRSSVSVGTIRVSKSGNRYRRTRSGWSRVR